MTKRTYPSEQVRACAEAVCVVIDNPCSGYNVELWLTIRNVMNWAASVADDALKSYGDAKRKQESARSPEGDTTMTREYQPDFDDAIWEEAALDAEKKAAEQDEIAAQAKRAKYKAIRFRGIAKMFRENKAARYPWPLSPEEHAAIERAEVAEPSVGAETGSR